MSLLQEVLPDFLGGLGAGLVLIGADWIVKRVKSRNNDDRPTSDEPGDEDNSA